MRSQKIIARHKRKKRIHKKVFGTENKPRLVVYRSLSNIYIQAVNDEHGKVLASSSTLEKSIRSKAKKFNIDSAKLVGTDIAQKLKKKKIEKIVFDRGGYMYHGKIKALADASSESGLKL